MRCFVVIILILGQVTAEEKLIFASALFRHGARAPETSFTASPEYTREAFPYGLGELTETGIRNSFELGRFLQNRYVDGTFLTQILQNKEVYFQSIDINRCLMTAQAVAQGMFSPTSRVVPLPVPVHTRPVKSDWMLAFPWNQCDALQREFSKYCYFPDIRTLDTFEKYSSATFTCHGAKGSVFNDTRMYQMIEGLISEEFAGVPLPSWYTPNLRVEARALYAKTSRFQLGMGEYHNPNLLRMTTGQLFDTILKEIVHKWNCLSKEEDPNCKAIRPLKFKAISTQDFILNGILESLGVRIEALGNAMMPQFSALVLFELWNVDGRPMIKVLYKRGAHVNQLINVSGNIRKCNGVIACPLETFAGCCDDYRTANPMEACLLQRTFPTPPPLPDAVPLAAPPVQVALPDQDLLQRTAVPQGNALDFRRYFTAFASRQAKS